MIYDLNEFHFVLFYLFIYCGKQIKRNLKEEKKNFKLCKKNLFRTEFSHT